MYDLFESKTPYLIMFILFTPLHLKIIQENALEWPVPWLCLWLRLVV